jgi:sec-independent protein translocase protein TatA
MFRRLPMMLERAAPDTLVGGPRRRRAQMHPVLGEIFGWEALLVVAVIALLFGSSKIPQLARSLGQASKEFRKGIDEGADAASGEPEPDGDKR